MHNTLLKFLILYENPFKGLETLSPVLFNMPE